MFALYGAICHCPFFLPLVGTVSSVILFLFIVIERLPLRRPCRNDVFELSFLRPKQPDTSPTKHNLFEIFETQLINMVRSKYQNCPGSSWLLLRKGALRRENALDCCFRNTQILENVPSDGGIDQKIRQGMDT